MAVHTSNVQALPHQIRAVYESMLPRQPLRFLLADDPGAGKTIMAGLYIRELIMRADARRILIVAPGSLVEQWRDELFEKFGLEFRVYSTYLEHSSPRGNPFEDRHQSIVRLDQLSRNEDLQQKLCATGWDLAVFDEAHKLAAHYFGSKLDKTGRFRLAERVGTVPRHLLLMTATPHNGKGCAQLDRDEDRQTIEVALRMLLAITKMRDPEPADVEMLRQLEPREATRPNRSISPCSYNAAQCTFEKAAASFKGGLTVLDAALDRIFSDPMLHAVIIDVRINFGGYDPYGLVIASRPATGEYPAYTKQARSDPGDHDKWTPGDASIVQLRARPGFRGPVVELMFTQALMGRTLPNEVDRTSEGRTFDGAGIPPDIPTYHADRREYARCFL
jgi:hypothetical protein